ncbi:cytochrome c biogenesis protein ResB [Propioniciclava soli]|uniref:cytochrome c biogenesis protein ResB n=1 Tax=Propioniciclava soli TaxID=2775081 RepID=UPI001E41C62E|nr:cytochrome c biogenesis protein ResB [Propioniciclava soli]
MEWLRWFWTQLTSMRTALILLFILALAAIPGSFVPQRPVNPIRVSDFIADNPGLGEWYERLGLFDVYGSPWFAAVYLLLYASLVGCIVPRIAVYARAVRTPPPHTPARLDRLPAHAEGVTTASEPDALAAAEQWLRARRFRTRREEGAVAAERGYLREFGNIVFHLSFVLLLGGLAWNTLASYRGEVIVVEGQAFSNNLTQYDDFRAGAAFNPTQLRPFTIFVDAFTASFETGPVQRGAAREFRADVRTADPGAEPQASTIEVNHPLRVDGTNVHLIGHGYAPVITITDPQGNVATSGPVVFLPQDGNFSSLGVVKAPDARPEYLALEGWFLPTAVVDEQGPHSVFPDALVPELFLTVWAGPPREETSAPESVYSINKDDLAQMTTAEGAPVAFRLAPGQIVDLPDGSTVEFSDWQRWVKLQVSSEPGLWLAAVSILLAIAGLGLSLYVRPRRLWVRVADADGTTRVVAGGLDRTDTAQGLGDDVVALARAAGVAELAETPAVTDTGAELFGKQGVG